jgi:hypothetical protein
VTFSCFFHTLPFDDLLWKGELENKNMETVLYPLRGTPVVVAFQDPEVSSSKGFRGVQVAITEP